MIRRLSILFFIILVFSVAKADSQFQKNLHLSDSLVKIDPQKAFDYAQKAIEIAKSENDSNKYFEATVEKSTCLNYLSKNEEAISLLKKAITYYSNNENISMLALSYSRLGSSYLKTQDFLAGVESLIKSNELYESIGQLDNVGRNYGNIGVVYYYQNQFDKAIEFYNKALTTHKLRKDKSGIASMYNNIGVCYDLQGKIDSALVFYKKSYEIRKQFNEKQGMADLLSNMGVIYKNKGDYRKALDYYQQSIELKKELNDIHGLGISHENMGSLYIKLNDFNQSIKEYEQAEKYYKELNSLVDLVAIYKNFAENYAYKQDYKNAFKYFKIHKELSDSLNIVEISDQINELETKYETEKKDREIDGLKKDQLLKDLEIENKELAIKEHANQQRLLIIGLVCLVLIIGFVVYGYLQKRKANSTLAAKNELIQQQKEKVETAHHELAEKNQEILDSINYAKRIQNAILPPPKVVKEYLQESFILYKPKDIVAGDFYWLEHKGDKVIFAACDCTGHGVPGAMVSVVCNNGLNRSVREYNLTDPGKILDKTREIVIQEFEKSEEEVKDGMDIALCSLEGNTLHYAGANNPLWIIRNNSTEIEEIKADKQPIGKYAEPTPYTTHKIELEKGDTIYIFSDGYADQFGGEKGKKFKAANFKKLLLSIQKEPIEKQREIINQAFEEWKGELEQLDDVCVIGVRI